MRRRLDCLKRATSFCWRPFDWGTSAVNNWLVAVDVAAFVGD